MPTFLSATNLADLTGTSLATAQKWGESGVYPYHKNEKGKDGFYMEELTEVEPVRMMLETHWEEEFHVAPLRDYTSVELFAGLVRPCGATILNGMCLKVTFTT